MYNNWALEGRTNFPPIFLSWSIIHGNWKSKHAFWSAGDCSDSALVGTKFIYYRFISRPWDVFVSWITDKCSYHVTFWLMTINYFSRGTEDRNGGFSCFLGCGIVVGLCREVLLVVSTQICYLPNRGFRLKLVFSGTVYGYSNFKGLHSPANVVIKIILIWWIVKRVKKVFISWESCCDFHTNQRHSQSSFFRFLLLHTSSRKWKFQ